MKIIRILVMVILMVLSCMVGFAMNAMIQSHLGTSITVKASESSSGKSSSRYEQNGTAINGEVVSKNPAEILEELKEDQINVTDKLSSSIVFPNGKAKTIGKWTVENVKTNNVIIQCEVYLGDNLIAKSVPIEPNQHIDTITLLQNVKRGQYEAIAYINYYKPDTKEYISKAGFKVNLTVQ